MSATAANRFELSTAFRVAQAACDRWQLPYNSIVGSVRREKAEVGDIELVAPHADPESDAMFRIVNATMSNPFFSERTLFAAPPPPGNMGRIERGLKPGFLAAYLTLTPWPRGDGHDWTIPCQIFRYTAHNEGWIRLMRTGPAEFGAWFLAEWKKRFGIRRDEQASRDGHLVDSSGRVVSVPTEEACFAQLRIAFIPPQIREEFVRRKGTR